MGSPGGDGVVTAAVGAPWKSDCLRSLMSGVIAESFCPGYSSMPRYME